MLFEYENTEYTFIIYCGSHDTRTGFAHDCTIDLYGPKMVYMECATAHCYYYNRTWEVYTYETVILQALNALYNRRQMELKGEYMEEFHYKRLTEKRKHGLQVRIANDTLANILRQAAKDFAGSHGMQYAK